MTIKYRHDLRHRNTWSAREHMLFLLMILIASSLYQIHSVYRTKLSEIFMLTLLEMLLMLIICAYFILLRNYSRPKAVKLTYKFDEMSGADFEVYIASLLPRQGFKHIAFTQRYDLVMCLHRIIRLYGVSR